MEEGRDVTKEQREKWKDYAWEPKTFWVVTHSIIAGHIKERIV